MSTRSPCRGQTSRVWSAVTCRHHPASPEVRIIGSPTAGLMVGAAPWSQVKVLLACREFQRPAIYVVTGRLDGSTQPAAYIGQTVNPRDRMADHKRTPRLAPERLSVITSRPILCAEDNEGLSSSALNALEKVLHDAVLLSRSHVITSTPPSDRQIQASDEAVAQRWVDDLRHPLIDAGTPILEAGVANTPNRDAFTLAPVAPAPARPVRVGWSQDWPTDLLRRREAAFHVLDKDGVKATAVQCDGWTVILAGSQVRKDPAGFIQDGLDRKRILLREQAILRPDERRPEVLDLTVPIAVPSLTNGGRLILGDNSPKSVWRRLA
ncbi:GIY-YIG nuclease family protein [Alsobacter sp. SYSU BS001988]